MPVLTVSAARNTKLSSTLNQNQQLTPQPQVPTLLLVVPGKITLARVTTKDVYLILTHATFNRILHFIAHLRKKSDYSI
jgi:hypothetical protein